MKTNFQKLGNVKTNVELITEIEQLKLKLKNLNERLDNPQINDFMESVKFEAAHQVDRWPKDHDLKKDPEAWLWLLCYLSTKAVQAYKYNDREKHLHHIITCAAACLNWHAKVKEIYE